MHAIKQYSTMSAHFEEKSMRYILVLCIVAVSFDLSSMDKNKKERPSKKIKYTVTANRASFEVPSTQPKETILDDRVVLEFNNVRPKKGYDQYYDEKNEQIKKVAKTTPIEVVERDTAQTIGDDYAAAYHALDLKIKELEELEKKTEVNELIIEHVQNIITKQHFAPIQIFAKNVMDDASDKMIKQCFNFHMQSLRNKQNLSATEYVQQYCAIAIGCLKEKKDAVEAKTHLE